MNAVKCNMGGKLGKQCRNCILASPHYPSVSRKCEGAHKCAFGRKVVCQCVSVGPRVEPLKSHYSGVDSVPFWQRVNLLKGKDRDSAYLLGVVLQDVEEKVLRFIRVYESLKGKRK